MGGRACGAALERRRDGGWGAQCVGRGRCQRGAEGVDAASDGLGTHVADPGRTGPLHARWIAVEISGGDVVVAVACEFVGRGLSAPSRRLTVGAVSDDEARMLTFRLLRGDRGFGRGFRLVRVDDGNATAVLSRCERSRQRRETDRCGRDGVRIGACVVTCLPGYGCGPRAGGGRARDPRDLNQRVWPLAVERR
jgi:hypothetical protein